MSITGAKRPLKLAADQKPRESSAAYVYPHEPENFKISESHSGTAKIRRFSQLPVVGGLWRFTTWWLVFFGIYASSSVCVF